MKYLLNENWFFKLDSNSDKILNAKIDRNKWYKAEVPGTIHTDLMKNNIVPDLFNEDNEIKFNWINELDWAYKTEFKIPGSFNPSENIYMIFEGVDTIADIYLNDHLLGNAKNMFLKYKFNIKNFLKPDTNEIAIFFKSPINFAKKLEDKHGKLPVALNSERVYIRKAQYSFGWDWGPTFPTIGLWKNVYIEQNECSIESLGFTTLSVNDSSAIAKIEVDLSYKTFQDKFVEISLKKDEYTFSYRNELTGNSFSRVVEIKNPSLWWPNGYGVQNLYDLNIKVFDKNENVLDSMNRKVGLRTIQLETKDENGKTFRLKINGQNIFAKGVNWIPADSFLPRVTDKEYYTYLKAAQNANMNIVRVWGGGIYENDIFYELCDELGLLVWQDFMFACGCYPEVKDFIENIKEEFKYNIKRLQYHTSLALWCGNNENEWNWYQEQKSSYKNMPGYYIFSTVLPAILKDLDPLRPYWESSPFGDDENPDSEESGNRHQWQIWSMWIDPKFVVYDKSLFVTEFGFQGTPNKSTLEKVIPSEQRFPQSYLFEFHNKQIEGNERIFRFLSGNLPVNTEWNNFIYLSQLNQGIALKTCLEHWLYNKPGTNGAIIWQINDCWPVSSWALIDSNMLPKLAYYFVKNVFQKTTGILYKKDESLAFKLFNFDKLDKNYKIIFNIFENDKILKKDTLTQEVKTFSDVELTVLENISEQLKDNQILISSIYEGKKLVHRNYYSNTPLKYFRKNNPKLSIKVNDKKDFSQISLESKGVAFFVQLDHPKAVFSNNGFIILPNEIFELTSNIKVQKKDLKLNYLNELWY